MRSHFRPTSVGKTNIRSHFISGAAIACAVTGATALMPNSVSAQAYDAASSYGSWTAGSSGGSGFGAWSFNGTTSPGGVADPGAQQTLSSAGAIGKAWTLFNLAEAAGQGSGISDVGRSITQAGGLQTGQTFETVIQNPSVWYGTYNPSAYGGGYTGWDVLLGNLADNNPAGSNTGALRIQVFNYFNSAMNWGGVDTGNFGMPPLTGPTTAAAGAKIDLALTSATTYSLSVTRLSDSAVFTRSGTLASSLPINYVNFRLYNTPSAGPSDVANNYGISYMSIVPEPATFALLGIGLGGLLFFRRRQ
jgi:hypothetical protein